MEMIFNINKQNTKNDDNLFMKNLNNLIDEIRKYHNDNDKNENINQKKKINYIVKINNNKYIIKIKNIN